MRDDAARALVHKHRISHEYAKDLVVDAAANLIQRKVIPRNTPALLLITARNLMKSDLLRAAHTRWLFAVAEPTGEREGTDDWAIADEQSDPAFVVEMTDTRAFDRAELTRALDRMPKDDRTLLNAYYFENRPLAKLDAELGLVAGGARAKAVRARNRMRTILHDQRARSKDMT